MKKQLLLFALLLSCSHLSAMEVQQQQQTNITDLPDKCLKLIWLKAAPNTGNLQIVCKRFYKLIRANYSDLYPYIPALGGSICLLNKKPWPSLRAIRNGNRWS